MKFVGGQLVLENTYGDILISTNDFFLEKGMLYRFGKKIKQVIITIFDKDVDVLNEIYHCLNMYYIKSMEIFFGGEFKVLDFQNPILEQDTLAYFSCGEKHNRPDDICIKMIFTLDEFMELVGK